MVCGLANLGGTLQAILSAGRSAVDVHVKLVLEVQSSSQVAYCNFTCQRDGWKLHKASWLSSGWLLGLELFL